MRVGRLGVCALLILWPAASLAQTSDREEETRRHHIGVQLGTVRPSADVIELGGLDLGAQETASLTVLNYRRTLSPRLDFTVEGRYWQQRWTNVPHPVPELTAGFFGPGIRLYGSDKTEGRRIRTYVQGSVYFVREELRLIEKLTEHGIGFGLSGGVDVGLSRLISIPIEATYIGTRGAAIDDLAGFGFSVGVNLNF